MNTRKLESFMAIGLHLGLKTASQYRVLAKELGPQADKYVEDHEHDPMPFLVTPPEPSDNADMLAIGLATYRLSRIAQDKGLITPAELVGYAQRVDMVNLNG